MMLPKDWKPLPCPRCERHDIGEACTHPSHELMRRLPPGVRMDEGAQRLMWEAIERERATR